MRIWLLQVQGSHEGPVTPILGPIDVKELEFDRRDWLGYGTYGVIYKGYFKGAQVAVKEIPTHTRQKDKVSEIVSHAMRALHAIQHPNIAQYIGHILTKERNDWYLRLLLEHIDGNNLEQILFDQNLKQKFNITEPAKSPMLLLWHIFMIPKGTLSMEM